jgi:hypothetical protein
MMNPNDIVLFTREEATQLVRRVLTDDEWLKIREWITSDDNLWEVIDECIQNTISEVITDEDQQEIGESN